MSNKTDSILERIFDRQLNEHLERTCGTDYAGCGRKKISDTIEIEDAPGQWFAFDVEATVDDEPDDRYFDGCTLTECDNGGCEITVVGEAEDAFYDWLLEQLAKTIDNTEPETYEPDFEEMLERRNEY